MTERTSDQMDRLDEVVDETAESSVESQETLDAELPAAEPVPVTNPPMPGAANPDPDGNRIAFLQHDVTGRLTLWIQPLDGSAAVAKGGNVELLPMPEGPQWSPDGALLAVVGTHPADNHSAIWLLNGESGEERLLVNHAAVDRAPRWSPDGELVAFVSQRDGREAIAAAGIDGTGPAVQLTHANRGQDDHDLCWSFDGGKIGFLRRTIEGEQAGDHIWTVDIGTGEAKQVTKRLARRRQLSWSPERQLVIHITDDGEWENVAVVNPDNSAGWNVASEGGDKSDPHYSKDGQRVVYSRLKDGVSRCCERAASSASAETIDPGNGTVASPRFLPDKRVLYAYAPATGGWRFIVQEPKADAARTELPPVVAWDAGRTLVSPVHTELDINGRKLGGLTYRLNEISGPAPAVIYLAEQPEAARAATFDPVVQALAASGLVVFTPSLPGTPGYGKKIANALKDASATELEAIDLVAIRDALGEQETVDQGRIAIAGRGYGGTLALVVAGARPGQFQAVVAIDPITDWDFELDSTSAIQREWFVRTFGLPATKRGVYALRTPSTFAGVIDAAVLLIGTDRAPESRATQLDEFLADMREIDASFEHDVSQGETDWETGLRAASFLRRSLAGVHSIVDDRRDQVLDAATV